MNFTIRGFLLVIIDLFVYCVIMRAPSQSSDVISILFLFVKNYFITCLFPFIYWLTDFIKYLKNPSKLISEFHISLHREKQEQKHVPKKMELPSQRYYFSNFEDKKYTSYLFCSHFSVKRSISLIS